MYTYVPTYIDRYKSGLTLTLVFSHFMQIYGQQQCKLLTFDTIRASLSQSVK